MAEIKFSQSIRTDKSQRNQSHRNQGSIIKIRSTQEVFSEERNQQENKNFEFKLDEKNQNQNKDFDSEGSPKDEIEYQVNQSVSSYQSNQEKQKSTLKGLLYGFGAASCYGLLICAVKFLFQFSNITVFEILYLRSLIAIVILAGILYVNKVNVFEVRQQVSGYLLIRCICGFVGFAIEFFAIKFTDLSKIVIILYNPFLTSIMSYLIIGEKVNRHDLLSFFVGVLGIGLLTDPFAKLRNVDDLIGISLAFLSAVIFNIGFIALRRAKKELNSWTIVFHFSLTNIFFAPLCFLTEKAFMSERRAVYQFEPYSMSIVIFIGFITVIGNFCVNKTLFHEKAARATAYYNMELLYTFIFDIFVMKSQFNATELTGVAMIVLVSLTLSFQTSVYAQQSVAESLVANVDQTTPPMGVGLTSVYFDLDLKAIQELKEDKMHLTMRLIEYTEWQDQRLAYSNNKAVAKQFQDYKMDISPVRYNIWRPNIAYTELNMLKNISETVYLFPNGTITYFKEILLGLTCQFNYDNIPSDEHQCLTTAYIINEFSDTAQLQWIDRFQRNRDKQYLTWDLKLRQNSQVDVRWKTEATGYSSGIEMSIIFKRSPNFYTKIFITPSIILIILAYITFWIDSKKAPARVILTITNINSAISLLISTNNYIPQVPHETWLQKFLIWNMIFTIIPIIQYAILNASIMSYEKRTQYIKDLSNELMALSDKIDNSEIPDQLLQDTRKLLSKQTRQRMVGGDFLQIEDFEINMKDINKNYVQKGEDNFMRTTTILRESNQPYWFQCCRKKEDSSSQTSRQRRQTKRKSAYQQNNEDRLQDFEMESLPTDPVKLLMFTVNKRKQYDQRRKSDFNVIMGTLQDFTKVAAHNQEILLRLRKIIRAENSLMYGLTECISANFDVVFRYLYASAFVLLMAGEYLDQLRQNNGNSFLAAAIVAALIFIISFVISIILYRKDASNLSVIKTIKLYLFCFCFKSKILLDNYD
eukprot:403350477